jgi:AcrR family transcriptional regulator
MVSGIFARRRRAFEGLRRGGVAHYSSGMSIPVLGEAAESEGCWSGLDAQEKRARLLRAAGEVFARSGLDAPMPAVAAAAGAGMGSVYRQFPSKRDLLAALVVERLRDSQRGAEAALAAGRDRWAALTGLLWMLAERQASDDVLGEAMATVSEHADVVAAMEATVTALEELLAVARAEGVLRADATTLDLRLLFAATRAAGQLEAGAWRRILELGIDGLRARS